VERRSIWQPSNENILALEASPRKLSK